MNTQSQTTLILGGNGKTGRRVADRLSARGLPGRIASRSTTPAFDWHDERTWAAPLAGAGSVYLTYYPELAIPGAAEHVRRFTRQAVEGGVSRIVLLAGRGEPQIRPAEQAVQDSGVDYTILECAFFCQNFSEGWMEPQGGEIAFPAGNVAEPFVDCDDVADVAVAALTDGAHAGKTYELTGPRLLTFAEAASELSEAMRRTVRYVPLSFEQYAELIAPLLPPEQVSFFIDMFRGLLDGHNARLADGVERALGRKPRDFRDYARAVEAGRKP